MPGNPPGGGKGKFGGTPPCGGGNGRPPGAPGGGIGKPALPGGGMLAPPADVGVMGGGKGGMEKPDPGRIGARNNVSDLWADRVGRAEVREEQAHEAQASHLGTHLLAGVHQDHQEEEQGSQAGGCHQGRETAACQPWEEVGTRRSHRRRRRAGFAAAWDCCEPAPRQRTRR